MLGLIREYGLAVYVLLFAYCALKSGALPLLAGYAAQANALELAPVATVTFLGGYLFGSAIERAVKQGWGPASVLALLVFVALGFLAWRRVNRLAVP